MKKLNIKNKILFIFALIAVFAIGGFFNLKEAKVAIADGGGLDYYDLIFEGKIEKEGFTFVLTKDPINGEDKFVIKEGKGSINWMGNKFVSGPSGIEIDGESIGRDSWWSHTGEDGKYEFQMILNMNPGEDNKLTDYGYGINFWVLKGQVVKEARKGAEGTFDFFIKEATAQILLEKEKKIEHPKIIFNGEVKIAPFGELSEIAQGEIRTTLEEPTEGLSGEIILNNFSYKIDKDESGVEKVVFFGEKGVGNIVKDGRPWVSEDLLIKKDSIKTENISEHQDKNLFSFITQMKGERGLVYWRTEGVVIEGIKKNYFIGEIKGITEEGQKEHEPGDTIRLTGEFEKGDKQLIITIMSHKSFVETEGSINKEQSDEILKIDTESNFISNVINNNDATDPRMIWSFYEITKGEKDPIEFVKEENGVLTVKGLRSEREIWFILNNTNIENGMVDEIQTKIIPPTIKFKEGKEVVRIPFNESYDYSEELGEDVYEIENGAIGEDLSGKKEEAGNSPWYKVNVSWEGNKKPDFSVIGTYHRNYQYEDHYGNKSSEIQRIVKVLSPDTTEEEIKLLLNYKHQGVIEKPVSMDAGDGNMSVTIDFPENLTITGESDWNGIIKIPTVVSTPVQPNPSSGMRTENVYSIEVGGNTPLLFDKPVKITFIGKAGHLVGWSRDGKFTPVTNICNPVDGSGLGEGADCKIDSGRDLVVWTRHMTVYTIYTESSIPRIGYRPAESITTITPIIEAAPEGQVLGAEKYNFTLLLKTGSRGTEVEELQKFLNDLGFDCGKVDGIFGKNTFAGVIAYQLSNKLKVDGIVGPETRGFLNK